MKFFKLLFLFTATVAQAKVLNFTQYNYEWVKGQENTLEYSYLEEPTFSEFQIRLYNSIDSKILKEVSTDDFSKKDSHSVTLSYPDVSTGKYRIAATYKDEEISNSFSVKLVLKASSTTTSLTPSATSNSTTSSDLKSTSNTENRKEGGNHWKTIAIIVSILVILLILSIIGLILYNRYKRNKQYEEEANTSIWKVPISEKSINIARGVNAYSVPNASITERDLSFSSDIDGFYSYSSQLRSPEYFSTHMGYRERQERTKSVNSYSTNVTKASNNILDILYPSNEKKEREKSLHEKSELSIDLGHSHSQKSPGQRRKKHSNSTSASQGVRNVRSSEVRARSNSFKTSAMMARKSRVSLAESETNAILNKKSRVSLVENERNTHLITANLLNENAVDITSSNVNNNSSLAIPISSATTLTGGTGTVAAIKSIPSIKNEVNPDTPEYYIKHTKLNKKYMAVCNFKPKLIDEMNVNKNDVVVIREIFTDGWGLGKNITTDKEGLLPLNCLNIAV